MTISVLAILVSLGPNLFSGDGSIEERYDDIANLVALLFIFVSVSSTLLMVLFASAPQNQRNSIRGSLAVVAIIFGMLLNSSGSISCATALVGVLSILLTIGADFFTPKSI
ncbi:hypothetical protein [Salinibacterium sp. PAMC 21357]|uniref:hypothetical protein n=1 Tax=Salinibacterium sp. PAMC 21357 TaxID=1112215 RepID=UPI0003071F95|nr:hypothetical protein [Salinibacterium sp. PAMC 21357]